MICFLIALWKQDNSRCPANSIDLQGGSKEIEDLEKLREVEAVVQRITITLELSEPEWENQVIVLQRSFFKECVTIMADGHCPGPALLGDGFSDSVSKWLRKSLGRRKMWPWMVMGCRCLQESPRSLASHWGHSFRTFQGCSLWHGMHPGKHMP